MVNADERQTIAISHEPSAMSSYLLSNANHLDHFSDGVDAHDVSAREDRRGDGGRRAPVAFGRRTSADRVAHEGLARRADEQRPVERRGQLGQSRQHTITVGRPLDRKSTRLNSSHLGISYAVFCLKK